MGVIILIVYHLLDLHWFDLFHNVRHVALTSAIMAKNSYDHHQIWFGSVEHLLLMLFFLALAPDTFTASVKYKETVLFHVRCLA